MAKKLSCLLLAINSLAEAHMQMSWPPPFRSKFNVHTVDIDYNMISPLSADGSDFPCKSYLSLIETTQGHSVATWQPGQTYNFSLVGGATHAGGSCQASLSFDRGRKWTVIHSYVGKCPLKTNWHFTLPEDTPSGDAVFAWTWFNNLGNREMYMNCAHVTVGRSTMKGKEPFVPFGARPDLFVANVGNACATVETHELVFPNPGPNVAYDSNNTSPPIGQCNNA